MSAQQTTEQQQYVEDEVYTGEEIKEFNEANPSKQDVNDALMVRKYFASLRQSYFTISDTYEEPGPGYAGRGAAKQCSLTADCSFCNLIENEAEKILYRDDLCVVFEDRKPRGKQHFQLVPRRHIRDIMNLRPRRGKDGLVKENSKNQLADLELIQYMVETGKKFMKERLGRDDGFLLGFHRPPGNSIYHLHLHMIELPLGPEFIYSHGVFLVPGEQVIKELEEELDPSLRGKIIINSPAPYPTSMTLDEVNKNNIGVVMNHLKRLKGLLDPPFSLDIRDKIGQNVCIFGKYKKNEEDGSVTLVNSKGELLTPAILNAKLPDTLKDGDILEVKGMVDGNDLSIYCTSHYVHPSYFDLHEFENMVRFLEEFAIRAKL